MEFLRPGHINTREGHLHGLVYLLFFGVPFAMAALLLYRGLGEPAGQAPLVEKRVVSVQTLENPTPLKTAVQICQLPGGELRQYKLDSHYEFHAWENKAQVNEVAYVLTFQPETFSGTGPVAVDITTPGQLPIPAVDTMSATLRECLRQYRVKEIAPGR